MNYTQKYHLPQWEENDRVMRTDFNSAMASLDSGITEAKSAADNAQAAAVEAAKLPYVAGSYTGTGETLLTITLGFRPSFLIISGMITNFTNTGSVTYDKLFALTGGSVLKERVALQDNGFTVYPSNTTYGRSPHLNDKDIVYDFLAFR